MGQSKHVDQLRDAEQIARSRNMFVVTKGDQYLLYRRARPRPVFLGARSDISAMRRLVARCASSSR